MDKKITAYYLKKVNLFSHLNKKQIDVILSLLDIRTYQAGETVFNEGQIGNSLYLVKKGIVTISIRLPDGNEKEIARSIAGDFFGEMSIFDQEPRSATCRAVTRSVLLELTEAEVNYLIKSYPEIAIKIMFKMLYHTTQRLLNANTFLAEMIQWGDESRKRVITDELTGVYNRRFLDEATDNFFNNAHAHQKPFTYMMTDLDHFREYNEQYGHQFGDQLIINTANVFKKSLREQDIIARFGGDEFVIILPETHISEGYKFAENIRKSLNKLILDGPIKNITISMGLAGYPDHADDIKTLKKKADEALYKAKENGRNRVILAVDEK